MKYRRHKYVPKGPDFFDIQLKLSMIAAEDSALPRLMNGDSVTARQAIHATVTSIFASFVLLSGCSQSEQVSSEQVSQRNAAANVDSNQTAVSQSDSPPATAAQPSSTPAPAVVQQANSGSGSDPGRNRQARSIGSLTGPQQPGTEITDAENADSSSDDESATASAEVSTASRRVSIPPPAEPSGKTGTEPGDTIMEIKGKDLDNERFALSDYEGKVIMLDFWGDW